MRIKLKFFVLGFLIATVLSFSLTSFADSMTIIKVFRNSVKIYLNNIQMTSDNFSFEGHTYVKLREVCEKLNKDISYDERTKTVFINNPSLVGDSIPDYDYDYVPIPIPIQIPVPKVIANDPIESGMYKVGGDLPAGEYLLLGSAMSYYQITKDSSGTLKSIISNDTFNNTRYITLENGQYLEFSEAKMFPIEKAPIISPVDGKYQEGMYKVGRDIEAGEYIAMPVGKTTSYIEVSKNSNGTLNSIITNDIFRTKKYITIKNGQYIKFTGCYIQYNNFSNMPTLVSEPEPESESEPEPSPTPSPNISKLYVDKTKVCSSGNHQDRIATRAFDGIYAQDRFQYFHDSWQAANYTKPQWISCEFEKSTIVTKYAICSSSYYDSTPTKWLFQGRNNNGDWITIDTINKQSKWIASQKCTFDINNITAYKYYRIYVTDVQGTYDYPVIIGEIEMYGY